MLGLEARVLESIADGGRLGNGGKRCSGRGLVWGEGRRGPRDSRAKAASGMDAGQVGSTGGLAVCLEHRTPTHPPLLLLLGGST